MRTIDLSVTNVMQTIVLSVNRVLYFSPPYERYFTPPPKNLYLTPVNFTPVPLAVYGLIILKEEY